MEDDRPTNPAHVEPPDPTMELAAVKAVITELTGKIQFLVDWADGKGLLEDHTFTFPDGDLYKAQETPEPVK